MLRFTIRELVLLTLVAALGIAWWLDHARMANEMAKWRDIAGALCHVMQGQQYEIGRRDDRLWVGQWGILTKEVVLGEHEPSFTEKEPPAATLPFYYDRWPRGVSN